jgi:hypothetical protein
VAVEPPTLRTERLELRPPVAGDFPATLAIVAEPATARYLGEREANRAYKKYGKQVFLFSPKRGVVCDRRTESCTRKNWVGNNNYGNWNNGNSSDRSTQARDGFGAIGSPNDWRNRQQQQYWPYDD